LPPALQRVDNDVEILHYDDRTVFAKVDNIDSKLIWLDKASRQAKKDIMTFDRGQKEDFESEPLSKSE
jgi:hypothetical protein